jgi:hypothetical protein
MNITSISTVSDDGSNYWNLFSPNIGFNAMADLYEYTVQKYEEMRIDSVMLSIYPDYNAALSDVDIILYINGIDNPLNIVEGMTIKYPQFEMLESFRIFISSDSKVGKNIRDLLAVAAPNKGTRKDSSRKKFVDNNYLLPPVVLDATRDPVRTGDGTILIGGLNNK